MEKLDRGDRRFLLVCLAVIAGGALVTAALFPRAFPEASIQFKVNRSEARRLAETFLTGRGANLSGTTFAGQFDVDETPKIYLERELGLEQAGRLYGREAKIWLWRMRWFRSGVTEEERAAFSPLGDLIGFQTVLKEDARGARLPQAEARALAVAFLASLGHPEASLTPIEATPVSRPHRTDWEFVDEKAGVKLAAATIRYRTVVAGDRVTAYREFVRVPESWIREYERLRSKNMAAGQVATAALLATMLAMLGVLVGKIVRKDVPWKLVAGFGAVGFVLALLSVANDLPLTLFGYDTASSLTSYLTSQIIFGILGAVGTGAGIALVIAAAEPIYRERFPEKISLAGAFSPRGIQTKGFLKSVVLGYALAAFFFAYQAVFYVVAGHFGAWAPADVPYSDMLNTALPWATVLLIGFLPAVSEEGISRMFSISFLDKLGAGRFVAVVVPAFIWGFGHSTYPNQPFYIRGLEVGMAGVLIGFLMLRYGVVPLLVWHFTVDAIYTALVLLRSGNTYYVISGGIASGILLLPLLVCLVLYARRGGFRSAEGLANGDLGFVAPPPREEAGETLAPVPDVQPLSPGTRAGMGVLALILASALLVPGDRLEPDAEDATGRAAAEALGRRFLQVNGADPQAWRQVAYLGTGFAEDGGVRDAQPQDAGGIPGYSPDAARYVIEKGGVSAFRKLTQQELPLSYWVVRFYQPENKEEWKALVDTRRSRVVAFVHPVAEDAPAEGAPSREEAERRALAAAGKLGYPAGAYGVQDVGTESRPKRVDTTVVLEAKTGVGEARPRLTAVFHGRDLAMFLPTIHIPETFLREQRSHATADWVLLAARIVAIGALVGLAIILFLRRVRQPDFRWRELRKPLIVVFALAAAGFANTIPYLYRQYTTEKPFALFRLGLGVSVVVGVAVAVAAASIGFVLLSAARPGWGQALRRRGSLFGAVLRAGISAVGLLGLVRWTHLAASRVPALYEPDPSLPGSLQYVLPPLEVLWTVARGTFALAVVAAVAALALRSTFFRSPAGRVLGAAAVVAAFFPSSLRSPDLLLADLAPTLLVVGWLAACAALLLRDHAAAWALFGVFTLGGRDVLELLVQPAAPDRAAGIASILLLAAAAAALLAGRRDRSRPAETAPLPPAPGPGPGDLELARDPVEPAPTSPWSGSA